ncbi:MAG: MarR family transcriptional regulator [Pseudomonadales bacterium]|jgi:DNA-binding MarR family transcriptional regulator|nr:MarR family transcriptional regulator [Pseudomonadales bacterium]MDP6472546.1 MarR family transcriptional regulator [Pseudomonadales bacterium]MDP6829028.1 MarR family transcriptional regulator [Pseudomonadales bacterium]MDP6969922.1 MarR family transcriptional regulator [Pseudomonadales bacterium]|tara:strand:+ start:715 stop:1221 length:507 start_codon:yes stop_codon:yes gene_type:complete
MAKKKRRSAKHFDWDRGIGFLTADITRLMTTQYNRLVKPMGLTKSQWRVIVHLHRQEGLSQSELAALLAVGKVSVGGLIDRLEQRGWVERRTDEKDRRSNRIFLTNKGRSVDKEMIAAGVKLSKLMLKNLTDDESLMLESLLTAVRDNLLELESEKAVKYYGGGRNRR